MKIYTKYHTKNACFITGQQGTTKCVVLHSTGVNNPFLKRFVDDEEHVGKNKYGNHWNNYLVDGKRKVMVHAFLGRSDVEGMGEGKYNTCISQILPYSMCAWHVGGKSKFGMKCSFNYSPKAVAFEVCEDSGDNLDYFLEVFTLAQEYCAMLCKEFKLNPLKDIYSHKETYEIGAGSSCHVDPHHWFDKINKKFGTSYDMDWFRQEVKKIMEQNELEATVKETVSTDTPQNGGIKYPETPFLIQVKNGKTGIYKSPRDSAQVYKTCPKGVYTITAVENNYGKLKSGAGYVYLNSKDVVIMHQ